MNFSWKNSAKYGALTGLLFFLFNTFGDFMLLGNSIYKEFYTIEFYKPLVGNIVIFSLFSILFNWTISLFTKKRNQ